MINSQILISNYELFFDVVYAALTQDNLKVISDSKEMTTSIIQNIVQRIYKEANKTIASKHKVILNTALKCLKEIVKQQIIVERYTGFIDGQLSALA